VSKPITTISLPVETPLAIETGPAAIQVSQPTTLASNAEDEVLSAEKPNLVGVRGWLLWFCIGITILAPLSCLGEAVSDKGPFVSILVVGLAGWYIFTGITVWREGRHALRYVAIFFVVQTCLGLVALISSVGAGSETSSGQSNSAAGLQVLIATLVWYLYFHLMGYLLDSGDPKMLYSSRWRIIRGI
jgi:hypothetical protein